jgi:squalene cyclase
MHGLVRRRARAPRRRERIKAAIERGVLVLRRAQRPDGAWSGFWGINFTYGTFHAVEALHATGVDLSDPAMARARGFLLSTQKPDGGWGEHYTSCLEGRYIEHPESQAAMTAWALLALLAAGQDPASSAVMRAVRWLSSRALPDGSWPRQAPAGVFFGTAMLDYRLYKEYFPIWALARHAEMIKK